MNSLKDLEEQRDPNRQTTDDASEADVHPEPEEVAKNEENTICGADENQLVLHNNQSAEEAKPTNRDIACADKEKHRKVSFPMDKDLVTGYLEPVNPWHGGWCHLPFTCSNCNLIIVIVTYLLTFIFFESHSFTCVF